MPTEPQITHYEGCWREHHGCALGEIDRLTAERDGLGMELGRVASERDEARAEREQFRAAFDKAAHQRNEAEQRELKALRERDEAARRLAEVEGRLPKTADGVLAVPGDILWRRNGTVIEECEFWEHCRYCECEKIPCVWKEGEVARCYSTPEAAAAAREAQP